MTIGKYTSKSYTTHQAAKYTKSPRYTQLREILSNQEIQDPIVLITKSFFSIQKHYEKLDLKERYRSLLHLKAALYDSRERCDQSIPDAMTDVADYLLYINHFATATLEDSFFLVKRLMQDRKLRYPELRG